MKKRVIIDCDPGIDDALAILLALASPELEVIGITTVSGNTTARKCGVNALKILKIAKREDIPVYIGDGVPLVRELVVAEDTHGEDGLGEITNIEIDENLLRENAVDFLIEEGKKENTHLIALGPLTNLAKALEKDRKSMNGYLSLTTMGGAFKSHGNCSQVAEFNYWVDPHSVQYVFDNFDKIITLVPLDVTRKCVLTPNYREFINQLECEKSDFVHNITKFYVDFHWAQERTLGCVINDPLVIAYLVNSSICSGFNSNLEMVVEGNAVGMTMIDIQGFYEREDNVHILTEVDEKSFMKFFLNRLFPNNRQDIEKIVY